MNIRIFAQEVFQIVFTMTTIKLFSAVTTSSVLTVGFLLPVAAQQVVPDGTTSTTVDADGTINEGNRAGG